MRLENALIERSDAPRPLWLVTEAQLPAWCASQPQSTATWVQAHGFKAERDRVLAIPGEEGAIRGVLVGLGALSALDGLTVWHSAALPERLPPGDYELATGLAPGVATRFVLGWLMGSYRFGHYRGAAPLRTAALLAPPQGELTYAVAAARATALARDLINTPANELGPAELAEAAAGLARRSGARCEVLEGDALAGYPLIRAVGAGSPRAPRLVDLRWGEADRARLTLVGKGVCFDSGGLDLKTSSAMLLMKKDMGGAGCALALASLLMELQAPVSLRVLLPCVENSVDGRSYRPGDVLRSRKGLTVEIGNTDAEGRLVLADALTEADGEHPDLLIDLATLTGAARTALGPELPAAYSPDRGLLTELESLGSAEADPVWPMPLWEGYDDELASKVADLGNIAASPFAGSVIAALFLKRFVTTSSWLHLDLYAWNPKDRPGRPVGAEAQCVRALYRLVRSRFG